MTVARRIVEEYPALANSNVYGAETATRLVDGKRVIPVLDGLDEMAEALRPAAIVAIDKAVTDQYPLVLTCRTDEYEEAVNTSGRMLAHAAVVEIQPGTIEQAMDFLREAVPAPDRWQPVESYLEDSPCSSLARVMSSPLMVDLARTVYGAAEGYAEHASRTYLRTRDGAHRGFPAWPYLWARPVLPGFARPPSLAPYAVSRRRPRAGGTAPVRHCIPVST